MSGTASPERALAPVRKTVRVAVSPARAFERFTAGIGRWWPLATHSVCGVEADSVEMEARVGGRIIERGGGEAHVWGTVTAWDPPARVEFTWHPGEPASDRMHVEVTFEAEGEATRVTLTHRGWESLGDGAADRRAGYDGGWDTVLVAYVGG